MALRRSGWVDRWIRRRLQRVAVPWQVSRRRIYILPTRFGIGFAVLCLVMLLGAMNYSNSMAFGLTFLMAAIGLVTMHHTHAQLVSVTLLDLAASPAHSGDDLIWRARLSVPSGAPRLGVSLQAVDALDPGTAGGATVCAPTAFTVSVAAVVRGRQSAPLLCIASTAPLGLFRAWTYVQPDVDALVYPRLAAPGLPPPPPQAADEDDDSVATRSGQSQFAGLRVYQRGESLNRVHWKSLTKSTVPMVKQFEDSQPPEGWLDLDQAPGTDLEAKLSQLARWVVDLEAQGIRYGLRLGGVQLPVSLGPAHRHTCLEALALHGRDT
jgi:uncharacterized protein (DUF58 family)